MSFWQSLKKPIIGLSPMDGVTDFPMRQIQSQIAKPDVMYTEFVSVEGFSIKPERLSKKLFFKENERPLIAQIFGHTPEVYPYVIEKIAKLGFDGIDINMGCPAKSVLQRGGGAALIGNFSLAEKIITNSLTCLDEITTKSGRRRERPIPLSIKTRIGKTDKETRQWFTFLSKFPLGAIAIHGRPLSQSHSGPVDWKQISLAVNIIRKNNKEIVILGNGGIKSLDEAKEKCNNYNLDGILIGQGALGNPWIFKNIPSSSSYPSKRELLETILKHALFAWDFYGEKGFSSVKKHFGWYPKGFDGARDLRVSLLRAKDLDEVKKIISAQLVKFVK